MGKGTVILTREGYDRLQQELEVLKGKKRREIAQAIAAAREKGDLSENAEYDAAREAQAMNEYKIAKMEDKLSRARIIDDSQMARDEALLGATVKVKDVMTGEEYNYMLVSEEESDFDQDKISVTSPVGKALLGHKIGDRVEVKVPVGLLTYEIIGITR